MGVSSYRRSIGGEELRLRGEVSEIRYLALLIGSGLLYKIRRTVTW